MTDSPPMTDDRPRIENTVAAAERTLVGALRKVTRSELVSEYAPFGRFAAEVNLQYALYVLLSLPVLAAVLGVAGLVVGVDVLVASISASASLLSEWVAVVRSNALYAAIALAAAYLVSVVKYEPVNVNSYGEGRMVEWYEAWEKMFRSAAVAVFPAAYFALLYVEPLAPYVAMTGIAPFWLAAVAGLLASALNLLWVRHRYYIIKGKENSTYSIASGLLFVEYVLTFAYLSQIHFGVDLLLWGSPTEPVLAAFFGMLIGMLLVARRIRWAAYQDKYGYDARLKNPHPEVWGALARGPLAVVVALVLLGGLTLTDGVALAVATPLFAAASYIAWRAYVTGDLKQGSRGRELGFAPGSKRHKETVRQTNDVAGAVSDLREANEALNEFLAAQSHEFTRVPEPTIMDCDPSAIKNALEDVEAEARGRIEGDEYTEFKRLHDAACEQFETCSDLA